MFANGGGDTLASNVPLRRTGDAEDIKGLVSLDGSVLGDDGPAGDSQTLVPPRPELGALARDYALAPLSPAQVLDRLLWFETWGWRVCRQPTPWWWLGEDGREAILPMPGPAPSSARIALPDIADPAWRETARAALDAVHADP